MAEQVCKELLEDYPEDVRTQATLAAVYLEQGRAEESREIALALAAKTQENTDDLYKVATVCCENDLHEEAYKRFLLLDQKMPYDGRMLYFKAVSAYKCGYLQESEDTLDTLCTVYPDAEVAKYYLRALREYREGKEDEFGEKYYYKPDFTFTLPDGRTIYWEHMGRMDLPGYRTKNFKKLSVYHFNDIYPPKNLIITMESKEGGIDVDAIQYIITRQLLPLFQV
jgi:tetratricopeptide (TPR) repeat protein